MAKYFTKIRVRNNSNPYSLIYFNNSSIINLECDILNLLMPIKDRDTLIAFEKMYGCYLTDFQKKIIRDRIDVINGESHFEEEML